MKLDRDRQSGIRCGSGLVAVAIILGLAAAAVTGQDTETPTPTTRPAGAAAAPAAPQDTAPAATEDTTPGLTGTAPPAGTATADGAAATPAATAQPADAAAPADETVVSDDAGGHIKQLFMRETEITAVLNLLSVKSGKNIIASKSVRGKVTVNLHNVTVEEALDAICKGNGFVPQVDGNMIYVWTQAEYEKIGKAQVKLESKVFHLNYTRASDIEGMIRLLLTPGQGTIAKSPDAVVGLPSGSSDVGGDSYPLEDTLIVCDLPEKIKEIGARIKELDRRPKMCLVEATILEATIEDTNALGIDFNALNGINFADFTAGTNGLYNGGLLSTNGPNLGQLNTPHMAAGTDRWRWQGKTSLSANLPSGGVSIGLLHNSTAIFIKAVESITDTVVLANPKVLALDKQRAEVVVGNRDGYITTSVSESTTVQSVQFLETGVQLIFRPFISNDGYVRMEIHPEVSDGGVTVQGDFALPSETTNEVTTNVIVKDGCTIVIGGLFKEETTISRNQIPFFGNIPGLGFLFRGQKDSTDRSELIILITPHVVDDGSEEPYYTDSSVQAYNIEDIRIGQRKGLLPWGRLPLAELHYRMANFYMRNDNVPLALWETCCALNVYPKFLEARLLQDKIFCRRSWEADDSSIRTFLRKRSEREWINRSPAYKQGEAELYPRPKFERLDDRDMKIKLGIIQPQ